jgi:hypothetical protein
MRKVVLAGLFAFTCVLPRSLSAAELKQNTAESFPPRCNNKKRMDE